MDGITILRQTTRTWLPSRVEHRLDDEPAIHVCATRIMRVGPPTRVAISMSGQVRLLDGHLLVRAVSLSDKAAETFSLVPPALRATTPAAIMVSGGGIVVVLCPVTACFVALLAADGIEEIEAADERLAGVQMPMTSVELEARRVPTWGHAGAITGARL